MSLELETVQWKMETKKYKNSSTPAGFEPALPKELPYNICSRAAEFIRIEFWLIDVWRDAPLLSLDERSKEQ